jgi:hypothetical protein
MNLNEKELSEFWEKLNRIDNINKITKEFQGSTWYNELSQMSWYSLTHTFSKNSIFLLDDTLQKLLNKEVVEIDEYVLRIVIKYLVFKFDKNIVLEVFQFILLNYDNKFISEEISSLVYDENEFDQNYDEEPIYKSPIFYLELLFEKDKIDKEFRKELIRKNEEVCIPSFNKYFDQFKREFGYTYVSPNNNNDSSNYGSFLDEIKHVLEDNGIDYDYTIPNTPHIGLESKRKEIWENLHGEGYYSNVYFLDRTDYTPKVTKVLKDLLTPTLLDLFIELKIKSEIKRFFLLGGITIEHLFYDNVFKYGFNFYQKHCSPQKWEDYQRELSYHFDGIYGIYNRYSNKFFSKYRLETNGVLKEYEIVLVGCNSDRTDMNTKYNEFIFFNTPYPDNIQIHELISDKELYYQYINSYREPENHIRQLLGLPNIGEGWVSETKLFYLIKEKFNNHRVLQHGKPIWLGKQHLDIFIPDLNIGVEYQGKQHTSPVDFFGGEGSFEENKKRDFRKKKLCLENGCVLYEVFPEDDFFIFVEKIYNLHGDVI